MRVTTLFALLLSIVLVLSACGGGNGKTNDNGGAAAENASGGAAADENSGGDATDNTDGDAASAAPDLKPYKITFVYEGPPQADEAKVEEALNKLLTEKINATIDIAPIDWGAWDDKMNLMIASREPVDVLFTAQWNGHAKNVAKGAYMDLGPLLEKHGQGIVSSLDPAFLEGAKVKGKNYAVPTNKELATVGGIVYRKDIAEELGIDMSAVKTISDLDAVYKVVKEKKPDITPLYMQTNTLSSHFMTELDYLGDTTIPGAISKAGTDTTFKLAEETEVYVNSLKTARDYFQKGYINKDAATTQLSNQDALKSGKVFSVVESLKPGKAQELANATSLQNKLEQVGLTGKTVSTGETAGSMLAISTSSKDPERAMMFINLLHTDKEVNNLLAFGIEGVHYTLNGDIMSPTDQTPQYAHGVAWELGNQFLNHVWDTEDPNKWENYKKFNEGAKSSPALGYVFDSEPVKAEVGALANVIKQYQRALETGSVDTDKVLPEYIAALKAAGADKVVAEKQKQIDAFLASK